MASKAAIMLSFPMIFAAYLSASNSVNHWTGIKKYIIIANTARQDII